MFLINIVDKKNQKRDSLKYNKTKTDYRVAFHPTHNTQNKHTPEQHSHLKLN